MTDPFRQDSLSTPTLVDFGFGLPCQQSTAQAAYGSLSGYRTFKRV
jgi:hypothetical protein